MITLHQKNSPPFLPCAESFVGVKILSTLAAYGTDYPFFTVWVQIQEGCPTALLAKMEETVFLVAEPSADYAELAAFLQAIGFHFLQAESTLLQALGFAPTTTYCVVTRTGQGINQSHTQPPPLALVYEILTAETLPHLQLGDVTAWYTDISHRLRHGTACVAIKENSAVAVCSHITDNAAVISGVATIPAARGRGIGKAVLLECISRLGGRNIFAACEKSLLPFYRSCGFSECGTVAQYQNINIEVM